MFEGGVGSELNNKGLLGLVRSTYSIEETSAFSPRDLSLMLFENADLTSRNKRLDSFATIDDSSLVSLNYSLEDAIGDLQNEAHESLTYRVVEGDNLSFIARDFNIDIQTIVLANNLPNINAIKPGMNLIIPPTSGVLHAIRSGDTLSGIAARYDVKVDEIMEYNAIEPGDYLSIGDEVMVPGGTFVALRASTTSYSVPSFAHLPKSDGYLAMPTKGTKTQGLHGRNAIDIASSCGTGIYAAAGGTITEGANSGWNHGYGLWLQITHPNGVETRYAHNSVNIVGVGTTVTQGQLIAKMGTTGLSSGCHLHYEVHGRENNAR